MEAGAEIRQHAHVGCATRVRVIDQRNIFHRNTERIAEGNQFPLLRAGIATGPTLPQSGDYYGRSVNLASRITGIARPGSVLVDTATREAAGEDGFEYSFAGERRLKGIDARTKLFRVRRKGEPRIAPDDG